MQLRYYTFILGLIMLPLEILGQSILDQEDLRFQAQMQGNVEYLAKVLAEDLLFIHSNAYTEDKQTFLANVAEQKIVYSRMQAEAGRKILAGKKMSLVRGVLQVAGTYNGKEFDIRVQYTAIYRKHKKLWRLLNWQSTKIPQ